MRASRKGEGGEAKSERRQVNSFLLKLFQSKFIRASTPCNVFFAIFFDLNVELCIELRLNCSGYALVFAVVEKHVFALRLSRRFCDEQERHAHHNHAVRAAFVLNCYRKKAVQKETPLRDDTSVTPETQRGNYGKLNYLSWKQAACKK